MKTHFSKLGLLAGLMVLAALIAVSPSQAAILTQPLTSVDWSTSFSPGFEQFDTSLGTLTGVDILFEGFLTSDITLTNNATHEISGVSGTAWTNMFATVGTIGTGDLNMSLFALSPTITVPGSSSVTLFDVTDSDSTSISVDSSLWSQFIGTGYIPASMYTLASGFGVSGGGGNVTATVLTEASGQLTLAYSYEGIPGAPVPEPATMILFGSGLMGLAGFGRKKLQKKEA